MYKAYAQRGEGPRGLWCKRCILPIEAGEPTERIDFTNDPDKTLAELNGLYHAKCAEPYLSLSRILNLNPWARF